MPLLLQNPRNSTLAGAGYLHDFACARPHSTSSEHAGDLRRKSIARRGGCDSAKRINRLPQTLHHLRYIKPVRLESLIG